MRSRRRSIIYFWLVVVSLSLACNLTAKATVDPSPTRPRRYVVLPAGTPTPVPGLTELSLPEPVAPQPSRRPRPTATPTSDNFAQLFAEVISMFNEPTATPTDPPRLVQLPTLIPTPTSTVTPLPTETPTLTPSPTLALVMPTPLPPPTLPPPPLPATPLPPPVQAPPPAPAAPPIVEPVFSSPISPPQAVVPAELASTFSSPLSPPAQAPGAVLTPPPISGFEFVLAEFYNSPTTNPFLLIYVAIVDANEIPIGGMKVVGTRLDHNLTYESPLSTWHFEGYNAPGEVIKSGNVKFEPPNGMETTDWLLHLEDAHGKRLSDDVPFNTDVNSKQWYFIKFKRQY